MTNANNANDLILVRSDAGDGGWSIHAPGLSNDEIAEGDGLLLCGTATMTDGGWDAPTANDYAEAQRRYARDLQADAQ